MHWRNFLLLLVVFPTQAQDNEMIRDYFLFKKVAGVSGFSCGDVENDYRIVRMLNEVGIAASMRRLGSDLDLKGFLTTDYWSLGVFLDLRCVDEEARTIFDKTTAYRMYGHLHCWLLLGRNVSQAVGLLNESAFSITTDLAISVPGDDRYDLYDAYNHWKLRGGSLNITRLGTWRQDDGLNMTLSGSKFARRWNYNGMKVKVAGIVLKRPKNKNLVEYLKDDNTEIMDNWPKFGYSIVTHVADMFNFSLETKELDHWDKNDTNGPIMNGLKEGSFDVSYYPSILTVERYNYANVILQIWPVRTCFMFLTIPSSKMNMATIFRPFAADAWYMIAAILVITVLVLSLILKMEKIDDDAGYGTSSLITIAAVCQQGLPFFSTQSASRLAFLQVMIFGLLVYNYYSAAIVSARLNTPLEKMNDSLQALVSSGMKLAAEGNVFFDFLLRNPTADVQFFKKHWEKIPEWKKFVSVEEGVKRITRGGFAFHADPTDAYPIIDRIFTKHMICQLTEVHLLKPSVLGLWSTRAGQFREITKIGLIRIFTAGLRKREEQRWSARKPYCNKEKLYVSSVTLNEAIPIIIILISGIALSLVICTIENIIFRFLQSQRTNVLQKSTVDCLKKIQSSKDSVLLPGPNVIKNTSYKN